MSVTIAADLSPQTYQQAAKFLSELDEDWARHIAAIGPCRHEAKPAREPYEALVRAIAYQQLHAKAGDAILGRLLALYPDVFFPTPEQLLASDPESQRACGFSATKLATIRGIAQATIEGVVRAPSEFSMTFASLPSMTATHEFVVPRSIPMTFAISSSLSSKPEKPVSASIRLPFTISDAGALKA